MITCPIAFPPGTILDVDGFVWVTLPPGTALSGSRILGTCSGDPSALVLQQVTVEQVEWGVELISPGQVVPFPMEHAFKVAVVGLEQHDVRARSTVDAPIRVSVHVRRVSGGSGGLRLRMADPITFQLTLLARGED